MKKLFLFSVCALFTFSAPAKINPPGCKNSGAESHNPNCRPNPPSVTLAPTSTATGTTSTSTVSATIPAAAQTPLTATQTQNKPAEQIIVTGTYGSSFTGYGKVPDQPAPKPYLVPPTPTGEPKVAVGTYGPSFNGYGKVPDQPAAYLVPPLPVSHTDKPLQLHVTRESDLHYLPNRHHIPSKAGRNMVEGFRSQFIAENGSIWTCALSGLSQRSFQDDRGITHVSGHSETLQFQEATTVHIPSNRRQEANCLIAVKKQIQHVAR